MKNKAEYYLQFLGFDKEKSPNAPLEWCIIHKETNKIVASGYPTQEKALEWFNN